MNSSGYIRGYMAKNMKADKFIEVVADAVSREFEKEVKLEITEGDIFNITIDNYKVSLRKCVIEEFQSPYGLDRLVLEALEKQGFIFDRNNDGMASSVKQYRFNHKSYTIIDKFLKVN